MLSSEVIASKSEMKVFVAILLVMIMKFEISSCSSQRLVKDMDRVELLQEILRRFFQPKATLRVETDVGFFAWISSRYTTSGGYTIKFNQVDRNVGNGYNTGTGMFVAPVAGLYHFYWNILSYTGKNTAMDLMLNGKERMRSYIQAQQTHERPSGSIYLRLQKGDKVYLKASGSGGILNEGRYSTFGGELIRH